MDMKTALASKKVSEKAGSHLQDECARYVSDKGPLPLEGTYTSRGYKLPCKHVIHVNCPKNAQVTVSLYNFKIL